MYRHIDFSPFVKKNDLFYHTPLQTTGDCIIDLYFVELHIKNTMPPYNNGALNITLST